MTNIRILVADDHAIVREGLRTLIASEPGMTVVGEAADGEEAVSRSRELEPDVILMDLVMPEKNGMEAIREIKKANLDARVLVLTSFAEEDQVFEAIKAGAVGYLLKDSMPERLLQAVWDVYAGRPSLHPSIALKMVRELNNRPPDLPLTQDPLTEQEETVLRLVAQGLTYQEIAGKLAEGECTVPTHVRNILNKLHLAHRTQAALYARRDRLPTKKTESA
jgi:NarL family two-component system response regulator LiaR